MAMQSGFIKRIRDIMRMDAGINGDAQRIEQMVWMLFLKVYDAKEDDWELNEDNYESIIPEDLRWRNWAKADSNGHAMTGDKLLNFVNNTLFPVLKGNDVKEGDTIVYEGIKVTPDTPIKKAIVKSTFEDANNYMKDGVYLRQVIDVIDEIEFDDVKESHAFGFVYEEILRELQSAGSSGEFYTPRAVTEFMALMIKPKLGEKMADFACGTGGFITSWLGQLSKQVTDTSAQKQLDDSIYGIEKKPFPYLLCVTNMLLHDIEIPKIYHMNSLKHNLLDYTDADKFDVILMNPPYGGHEDKSIQGFFPDDLASSETADLFMSVILYRLKKNGRAAVVVPDGFLFGLDNAKVNIKKKLIGEFNLHTVVRLPGSVFSPYTSITTNLLFFDNTKPTTETWFYRVDIPSDRKHFSKTKPMELKNFDDCIAWWNNREVIPDGEYFKAQKYTADYLLNEQGCNIDLCGYPHEEEEVLDPLDTIREYDDPFDTFLHIDIEAIRKEYLSAFQTPESTEAVVDGVKSLLGNILSEEQAAQFTVENVTNALSHGLTESFLNAALSLRDEVKKDTWSVCFSENGFNEVLWLKYADQHRGFVQIYDLENNDNFLCGKQEKCANCGIKNYGTPLYPIYYSDTPYDATKFAKFVMLRKIAETTATQIPPELYAGMGSALWEQERTTLIKKECHKYDEEWRMITGCIMKPPVMMEWIPSGIILGLRMGVAEENLVVSMAKEAGIKNIYKSYINAQNKLDAYPLKL